MMEQSITHRSRRQRTVSMVPLALLVILISLPVATVAFSSTNHISRRTININNFNQNTSPRRPAVKLAVKSNSDVDTKDINKNADILRPIVSAITTASLALALTATPIITATSQPQAAYAYEQSDYASETVTNVVSQLKSTAGDVDGTFNTLEEVAKIITEGKGVGGTLTYDGVKLAEGQNVADEDTTIYNPGLTLLTSSEKERLVSSIIDNRKVGLSTQHWSENNEYAFSFLKQKLDPLHMHELEGYLGILPFWGAALYLVALFVQKNVRGIFPL